MVKLAQSTIKYLIEADFTAEGVVERPDVIGAIFGQTEGLLGADLDLRELQRTGRIGRIDVDFKSEEGKTTGKIFLPSSLGSSETSLIAASLEAIEKIGPCSAEVKISIVRDVRSDKREFVVDRAKTILGEMLEKEIPDTNKIKEEIQESVRASRIKNFKELPCGPEINVSDEIIIVEGRADVLNLLKNGVNNVIAMGGATVPQPIIALSKEKMATLFVDGDRAGDLIVKEFLQLADVDYITRAPEGKEVEELSKKEVFKALRDRTPIEQYRTEPKYKELTQFIQSGEPQPIPQVESAQETEITPHSANSAE